MIRSPLSLPNAVCIAHADQDTKKYYDLARNMLFIMQKSIIYNVLLITNSSHPSSQLTTYGALHLNYK